MGSNTEVVKVKLNQDFSAEILNSDGSSTGEKADWNMIYDQAMFVNLPSRNIQMLANFKYTVDPRVPEEAYHMLQTGTYEAFKSKCTETMVGVVMNNDTGKEVQCYVGYQE